MKRTGLSTCGTTIADVDVVGVVPEEHFDLQELKTALVRLVARVDGEANTLRTALAMRGSVLAVALTNKNVALSVSYRVMHVVVAVSVDTQSADPEARYGGTIVVQKIGDAEPAEDHGE